MAEAVARGSTVAEVPVMGEEEGEAMSVERRDGPVTLRLLDASLWNAFRQEGTEMIITKAGRRMFPFLMVKLEGLSPTLLYSVHLSLVPCDNRQYKFCQRRWVKVSDATPGPVFAPEQAYMHPASPNRGSFWCQEMISFAKLKITNNKHSQGDIVLQSMRKYMAKITVREDLGDAQYIFSLPETTFVAVTQYQNEAVTRMKIAHNPFANGFKYAHVTGSEDGKKLSRSDLSRSQDSKQKYSSSSATIKSSSKTARVKAAVSPQTLPSVLLSSHAADDLKLVSSSLSLPTALQPLYTISPALGMEAEPDLSPCLSLSPVLPGRFLIPSTATISPYVFTADISDSRNDDVLVQNDLNADINNRSPDVDGCAEAGGRCCLSEGDCSHGKDSAEGDDEEDEDECHEEPSTETASPISVPSTTISAAVTDTEDRTSGGPTTELDSADNTGLHEPQAASLTRSSKTGRSGAGGFVWNCPQSFHGVATSLSKKGEPFKQPLPKRGAGSAWKTGKKSSVGGDAPAPHADSLSGTHWYKAALRQASQTPSDPAVKLNRGIQLKLQDAHIWHSFAACGSKMVINAEGRNMFPVISVTLRGLDPGRLYSVWLHVTPADAEVTYSSHVREPTLWGPLVMGPSRRIFASQSVKSYMHPSSPMRGLAWMKVKVTFSEVKLTILTSDSAPVVEDSLRLQVGRRYLTQIVVREEEEVTPSGTGSIGDLYFFPLPEVTFWTQQENEETKSTLPVTSITPCQSETRKRARDNTRSYLEEDSDEVDGTALTTSKVVRVDVTSNQRMRSPVVLSRHADLSPLMTRPTDLSPLLPRQTDLCSRINPLYCFPPVSTLPPAHVGLLANRMPLPVASPLQSLSSLPFHSALFPQLRTPMHSAFGMVLSSLNPFPYFYYPYSLPPASLSASTVSEAPKGLDLSLKKIGGQVEVVEER